MPTVKDMSPEAVVRRAISRAAHVAVHAAIKDGRLARPKTCEACRRRPRRGHALNGHHRDYSEPLLVVWLCRRCHTLEHLAMRGGRKAYKDAA